VNIIYEGKTMKIRLANVMHMPRAEGKILSLKVPGAKGFESHILADCIHISRDNKTYAKAPLGRELYKIKMKVVPLQENVLTAVKRDNSATDSHTWHWRLGHLGNTMIKKLVSSNTVKDMVVTNNQLEGVCGSCILGKMMRDHLKLGRNMTHKYSGLYMPTS